MSLSVFEPSEMRVMCRGICGPSVGRCRATGRSSGRRRRESLDCVERFLLIGESAVLAGASGLREGPISPLNLLRAISNPLFRPTTSHSPLPTFQISNPPSHGSDPQTKRP